MYSAVDEMNAITAEEEFKKNKDLKAADLQILKEWYSLQSHLPPIPDERLIRLFHSCWYRMEQAKQTTDNYFTMRTHTPELFDARNPFTVNIRNDKPVAHYCFLSNRTPSNHRVFMMKLLNTDPSAYVFAEASKSFFMHYDIELHRNGTADGDVMIFDMDGITLGHLARLNPVVAKKVLYYIQEAMPIRLLYLHFVNVVPFMDKIMALLRPFMNKEFVDKMKFHTDGMDSLYEYLPQNIMPADYGGQDKPLIDLTDEYLKILQSHQSWFEEDQKLRVDESKRAAKSKIASDIFGAEGSFKKLDID